MRFAIRISKGITLSSCYPIQLSRNRRPRKGGNPARPSRPCQAGWLQLREPNPSDADTLTLSNASWKRSAGPNYFAACRDWGSYCPGAALSTTVRFVINHVAPLMIPRFTISDNHDALLSIPSFAAQPAVQIRVTSRLPKIPYRSGTSLNDTTPGPIPTIWWCHVEP
jgi:hypothetical protein